jgi:hypothetical protein
MGWGPRGDSGSARSRVRASQPTQKNLPQFILKRYEPVAGLEEVPLRHNGCIHQRGTSANHAVSEGLRVGAKS